MDTTIIMTQETKIHWDITPMDTIIIMIHAKENDELDDYYFDDNE